MKHITQSVHFPAIQGRICHDAVTLSLEVGRRLGPYETLSLLGKGGMGEVYRARDSRLGREVAIKVLPEEVARDPERLARFQREARALAALNHPHVATLLGIEQHEGKDLLVMELVHGETLADRISRGAIPVDEAIPIFLQIAEGLEAAHEKGIIHRDLKPANIKLGADGASVKILDFGLAKAMAPEDLAAGEALAAGGADALSHSPTLTLQATRRGEILGTAQYMSPEQARGLPVDRRTDVWAFGACLYEALTGKPSFAGDDASSILASILRDEPAYDALPAEVPPVVRAAIHRCLAKRTKDRQRDIGDVALELREALDRGPSDGWLRGAADAPATAATGSKTLAWAAAVVVTAIAAFTAGRAFRPEATGPGPVTRSVVSSSSSSPYMEVSSGTRIAMSRDGSAIAWLGRPGRPWSIYVRRIDQLEATPLDDTEGSRDLAFSPDGAWIAFLRERTLTKIPVAGGARVSICEVLATTGGLSWGDDDRLYVGGELGLYRVASTGGELEKLLEPDRTNGELGLLFPEVLPGAKTVLIERRRQQDEVRSEIVALDLESRELRVLLPRGGQAQYVATNHLLFAAGGGRIGAVGFDPRSLEVRGDPTVVAQDVSVGPTRKDSAFAASANGSLAYLSGVPNDPSLVWVDRRGIETPWLTLEGRSGLVYPRFSPDGRLLALTKGVSSDLWILRLSDEYWGHLTFGPEQETYPVWSHDARSIIYASGPIGDSVLMRRSSDGSGGASEALMEERPALPVSLHPDGRTVVYRKGAYADFDLKAVDLDSGKTWSLIPGRGEKLNGEISPDGRFIAYESRESSGRYEVYVRPFPDVEDGHWQVSKGGGQEPLWSRDGRELFYREGQRMMAVPVETATGFEMGTATELFAGSYMSVIGRSYDVTPDGRFLMVEEPDVTARVVLVQNLGEELKRRIPME